LKYEDIYLKDYATVDELNEGLTRYFEFYNQERFHQALNYQTPYQVYHWGPEVRSRSGSRIQPGRKRVEAAA
jgi:transposase InsO family protein